MKARIEKLSEKKLIGICKPMSFADYNPAELWKTLMPRRKEIINNLGTNLYSIEIYKDLSFFQNFDPKNKFEKWAAIEVSNFENIPDKMEKLIIPDGLYAVFIYKGLSSEVPKIYTQIFTDWLPNSDYQLDNRPHFALMGDKYKHNDPASEEEIWVPVKYK